jgi:hypothetical protein
MRSYIHRPLYWRPHNILQPLKVVVNLLCLYTKDFQNLLEEFTRKGYFWESITNYHLPSTHHLSRETSTDGHRLPPKFFTTIGIALLSSSGFPRPSPDLRSTRPPHYQLCVSRDAVAIRGPFYPNDRQSSSQCALPTATWGLQFVGLFDLSSFTVLLPSTTKR